MSKHADIKNVQINVTRYLILQAQLCFTRQICMLVSATTLYSVYSISKIYYILEDTLFSKALDMRAWSYLFIL